MLIRMIYWCCLGCFHSAVASQITTGTVQGRVRSAHGDGLPGITVKLVHSATGFSYQTLTTKNGAYLFYHIDPGTAYLLEVKAIGYQKETRRNVTVRLGETTDTDLVLTEEIQALNNITVRARRKNDWPVNTIDSEKIAWMPASGQIHDYLRAVPAAKLSNGNEGAISFAGQNNRYNAFYIDGAVSNDVFGLSASGMNGGQAGISPLSMEGINQLQVLISPADVSIGNFTGAAIQATTRSGSNRTAGAVYHSFSNAAMAGKTPDGLREDATRPAGFSMRTSGARMQGAIVPNRLFYFINIELQRNEQPQPFNLVQYKGYTNNSKTLLILANTLQSNFHYDAGSFTDNPETVNAARLMTRFDWNAGRKHKLSFSYRHVNGTRLNTNISTPTLIHFSNDGYEIHTATRSASLDIKSSIANRAGNKLLLSYTQIGDNRHAIGHPFPRVRINDGDGALQFGTDISSTINQLKQRNASVFEQFSYHAGRHMIDAGMETEYSSVQNSFVQNGFGSYSFSSLADFLTNDHPSYYQAGYAGTKNGDHTNPGAAFATIKSAIFINDKMQFGKKFSVHAGLRIDQYLFLHAPTPDEQVAQIALPAFEKYRDIGNAGSGKKIHVPTAFSPRIEMIFFPRNGLRLHAGAGIFTGRIPLAWVAGAYQNNGNRTLGYEAAAPDLKRIRFRADPLQPWQPGELGNIYNNVPLNLVAGKLSMPRMVRAWLSAHIALSTNWWLTFEAMAGQNIEEIEYRNINLLPPLAHAVGDDNRLVYTLQNNARIPLLPDGSNPYDHAILLRNLAGNKGYTVNYTLTAGYKNEEGMRLNISYHFNRTMAVNDGTSSVSMSQWRFTESVNGRNDIGLSVSDFSAGHRIFLLIGKDLRRRDKSKIGFALTYTGESGQPFSYVYGNASMTRDDGPVAYYDLLFVPTHEQILRMQFVPLVTGNYTVGADQQRADFDNYISRNPYLNARRGQYAERNGSRTPFTHIIDLKLKWDLAFYRNKKQHNVLISADIFNLGNLLNRNWGRRYVQLNDNFAPIDFMGYTSETNLVPQYQFVSGRVSGPSWKINPRLGPFYTARWIGQLGFRLTF